MCIPCHASWLTHQATQGTRASCINQPMVNVTVTVIKLEHERLQIAPVRKKTTIVMSSMLCKININNIFKWGKVHPSVGLLWCHKGAGCVVATARWPPLDFIYFPFIRWRSSSLRWARSFGSVHLKHFALFRFVILNHFYCIYRWPELSETTQRSHWLAFRTALRHKDEPDSIVLRLK